MQTFHLLFLTATSVKSQIQIDLLVAEIQINVEEKGEANIYDSQGSNIIEKIVCRIKTEAVKSAW